MVSQFIRNSFPGQYVDTLFERSYYMNHKIMYNPDVGPVVQVR